MIPKAENRDKFGLPVKPLNPPVVAATGLDDRVKSMLGNGLKLGDLKTRHNLAGIEQLKKKV